MRPNWFDWFLYMAMVLTGLYLIYVMFTHPRETETAGTEMTGTNMPMR